MGGALSVNWLKVTPECLREHKVDENIGKREGVPALQSRGSWKASGVAGEGVQDEHFELLVLAVGAKFLDFFVVDGADEVDKAEEDGFGVGEVEEGVFDGGGAHGFDIEADAFAVQAEAVLL